MTRTLRLRLVGALGAAAMLAVAAFAAAGARPAAPVSAAGPIQDLFFQSDITITPTLHLQVGNTGFYNFALRNLGISGGTVSAMQLDCGIRTINGVEYVQAHHWIGNIWVDGNSSVTIAQTCTPPPHSSITGARVYGQLDSNDVNGPGSLSAQVGYLKY